ncbi:hypothetical protein HER10_EVM0005380 [Colletotrichum scovillei]|uniref:Uncharacterized protein n=1 Tax=Colletotrichum scovillei TaxID=1209932 RepID=A0A9P7RL86_9PEZI|nr:uncharacterized protein HER10_EVM0005380 [Colletotrichum scovillei]KAF4777664.1 hypothetical protein HER10_EVM0005380 [Colletotrichum scovillei]KAG7059475.1 hypothetical protein JMJ77_0006837 [Colletotrichum scovillei]KAG7078084.1 hypothetical protein JMJ76_0015319 [Colletotrichum scovillei]KAG7085177.1 hypothetical protein JMJ78_0010603 [Colletotrichum scovillei]
MSDQLSKTDSQTPLIKHETSESKPTSTPKKRSLYQRMQDRNRVEISEEELQKYTGMSKAGLQDWAKDRPGVGAKTPANTGKKFESWESMRVTTGIM